MAIVEQIEICVELPNRYRAAAAEIYYEAFRRQLGLILSGPECALPILQEALVSELIVGALHVRELVGICGLRYQDRNCVQYRLPSFLRQYGWLKGWLRYLLAAGFRDAPCKQHLMIECLAVRPALRGQGIGTQLIQVACHLARVHGLSGVCLEVLDTNPDARRLYERLGFVAVKTRRYPYLRHWLGLSAVTTMVKALPG